MIVVEQSLNLALSLADDTVFLEKGEVRHSGPARDLIERPELMHAVLFGAGADNTELPSDPGNGS